MSAASSLVCNTQDAIRSVPIVRVTLSGQEATSTAFPGVVFNHIVDEPEPVTFSAVRSPGNRSRMFRDTLDLAGQLSSSKPSR